MTRKEGHQLLVFWYVQYQDLRRCRANSTAVIWSRPASGLLSTSRLLAHLVRRDILRLLEAPKLIGTWRTAIPSVHPRPGAVGPLLVNPQRAVSSTNRGGAGNRQRQCLFEAAIRDREATRCGKEQSGTDFAVPLTNLQQIETVLHIPGSLRCYQGAHSPQSCARCRVLLGWS